LSGDSYWKLNIRTDEAKKASHEAIHEGVAEIFELDVKPEAIKESPYLTGTNRRSIDTDVTETPEGIQARIFSQSGYGGYLEIGTRKMKARPYMFPALYKYIKKLGTLIGEKIKLKNINRTIFKGGR
jgi:HK97 gp10 family phage protein